MIRGRMGVRCACVYSLLASGGNMTMRQFTLYERKPSLLDSFLARTNNAEREVVSRGELGGGYSQECLACRPIGAQQAV